jgi:peptidoglycan/LPS O-acetylase OafA/YrhL
MASQSTQSRGPAYLPALTGVRAFAAMMVLLLHTSQNFPTPLTGNALVDRGYLGVDLFFILSGFIIAHVYLRDMVPLRARPLGIFLWHRFIRLFPAHATVLLGLVVLITAVHWAGVALNDPRSWNYRDLPWHFLMVHAWGVTDVAGWNSPSWSISAEWFAYLLFPGAAALVLALPKHAALPLVPMVLLIGAGLLHLGGWSMASWIGMPALIRVATEFIGGVLIYRAVAMDTAGLPPGLSDALTFGGVALFCAAAFLLPIDAVLIVFLAVIIAGVAGRGAGVRAVFGCAPVLWLGEISYSIYVVHFPIVLVLRHVTERFAGPSAFASGLSRWGMFLLAIGVVIALAALLFYTIEQPARRRLRNLFGRIDASAAIGVPADAGVGDRVG